MDILPRPGIPSGDATSPPCTDKSHGDTFSPPMGAVQLAESDACGNQAFRWGRSVIGLQFHLERPPESVRDLVRHCREELRRTVYAQTERAILLMGVETCAALNRWVEEVLGYLFAGGGRCSHGIHGCSIPTYVLIDLPRPRIFFVERL